MPVSSGTLQGLTCSSCVSSLVFLSVSSKEVNRAATKSLVECRCGVAGGLPSPESQVNSLREVGRPCQGCLTPPTSPCVPIPVLGFLCPASSSGPTTCDSDHQEEARLPWARLCPQPTSYMSCFGLQWLAAPGMYLKRE